MILPGEIQKIARKEGVRDQQIEKDYILSWILQGIAIQKYLSSSIVFKGGTVLKKVYFETYRYSEDLDFTLLNKSISNQLILEYFNRMFEYVKETANIPLEIIDKVDHEDGGFSFYIGYLGPLGGKGANKRIKVDISRNEQLKFEVNNKTVLNKYSDYEPCKVLCYSLEEVLVEKLRSIIQRMQARDLYDLWYLIVVAGVDPKYYRNEFISKCLDKKLNPSSFWEKLEQRLPQYKSRWQSSMQDQIKNLPDFNMVERDILRHLKKIDF